MSISADDFCKFLKETAETFCGEVVEDIELDVMNTAKDVRRTLSLNLSPKRWTKYRRQFTVNDNKVIKSRKYGTYTVVIWNRYYQIIHLLELGTLNSDGTQRTKPQPHMKPANEIAEERINELIRSYKNGN